MSHTLTVRLTDEILDWLRETSRRTGIPVGRLIREQLETAKSREENSVSFAMLERSLAGRRMFLLARDFPAHEGHCRRWPHRGIRPTERPAPCLGCRCRKANYRTLTDVRSCLGRSGLST